MVYQPLIVGAASVRFVDNKAGLNQAIEKVLLAQAREGALALDWSEAKEQRFAIDALKTSAGATAQHIVVPGAASKAANYKAFNKDIIGLVSSAAKVLSFLQPVYRSVLESARDGALISHPPDGPAAHKRNLAVEQLRAKYAPKVNALEDKVLQAETAGI